MILIKNSSLNNIFLKIIKFKCTFATIQRINRYETFMFLKLTNRNMAMNVPSDIFKKINYN
jgi:hypothetical protein